MNVQIEHNSSDITQYVISYDREHKICTGIGILDIVIDREIPVTFEPWDSIDIHENGDFKVRYYVSDIVDEIPSGTISLRCQDNSKRLVDYFIPDSYTIEEPSYTRYWIEKFLDEAGISYTFDTSSQGNLLSNFTGLGLASAYEQILQLLQLSGWYMYFDGNGIAKIGKLNKELSPVDASLSETDILSISVIEDDKMLRNRAVVLGAFDPIFNHYASADVSVTTRWNYDHNDKRAIVISNSNIPNKSSALGMANQLIKEFARITIEKHLEVTEARDLALGDVVKVSSRAYAGKGLVTTFGVTMDRNGLITKLVLDERCPRMFGFFNFGDYVYVSTFGSGIWRKHLEFDHTWYNFSDGLDQLAITDLHIANGLFTSVGASGEMYYNLSDDTAWTKLNIESLLSVPPSGIIVSGGGTPSGTLSEYYTYPYSGIMGRATILDRDNARMLFAVDNASGINYGDYYLTLSGILFSHFAPDYSQFLYSGVVYSGGINPFRGWILEYNPVLGETTSYPIHVSGNYNVKTFDIETDGEYDYVSIFSYSGMLGDRLNRDWGFSANHATTFPPKNNTTYITPFTLGDGGASYPDPSIYYSSSYDDKGLYFYSKNQLVTYSGILGGELLSDFLLFPHSDPITLNVAGYIPQEDGDHFRIMTRYQIIGQKISALGVTPYVYQVNPMIYDLYFITGNGNSSTPLQISKWTADFEANTLTSHGVVYNESSLSSCNGYQEVRLEDTLYIYRYTSVATQTYNPATANATDTVEVKGILTEFDLSSGTGSASQIFSFELPESPAGGYWRTGTFGSSLGFTRSGDPLTSRIYVKDDVLHIIGIHSRIYDEIVSPNTIERHLEIYRMYGPIGGHSMNLVYSDVYTQSPINIRGPYSQKSTDVIALNWGGVVKYLDVAAEEEGIVPYVLLLDDSVLINYDYIPTARNLNIRTGYGTYGVTWNESAQKFYRYHFSSLDNEEILPPDGYNSVRRFYLDPVEGTISTVYVECTKIIEGSERRGFVMPYDVEENRWYDEFAFYFGFDISDTMSNQYRRMNNYSVGNWFIHLKETGVGRLIYLFTENNFSAGSEYMLLQKKPSEDSYTVIERSNYPIRADISQYSPILTVTDKYITFNTFYPFGSGIESVSPVPTTADILSGVFVHDYRYSLFPDPSGSISKQGIYLAGVPLETAWISTLFSGVVISGIDETNQIRTFDVYTYSGIENVLNVGYSGMLNNIEATNYAASGQYIFVTTSGDQPRFYQKDALESTFIYYSGLPMARTTMIRIDDRV